MQNELSCVCLTYNLLMLLQNKTKLFLSIMNFYLEIRWYVSLFQLPPLSLCPVTAMPYRLRPPHPSASQTPSPQGEGLGRGTRCLVLLRGKVSWETVMKYTEYVTWAFPLRGRLVYHKDGSLLSPIFNRFQISRQTALNRRLISSLE